MHGKYDKQLRIDADVDIDYALKALNCYIVDDRIEQRRNGQGGMIVYTWENRETHIVHTVLTVYKTDTAYIVRKG